MSWNEQYSNCYAVTDSWIKTNVLPLVSDSQIKTMLPGEHQQVLSSLQAHFEEFLEDSEESEVFTMADRTQLERDVVACKEYYEELLKSAERGKAEFGPRV